MAYKPKPHVSAALAHLRVGVSAAASIFAACAAVQLLVFGFVHFTQIRFQEASHAPAPFTVVGPGGRPAAPVTSATALTPQAPVPAASTIGPTFRIPSRWDAMLHIASDINTSIMVVSGVLLALFCTLGALIAGGASVPGVQGAVSAATWSALLAVVCLPWNELMPSLLFKGAFGDYATMTGMSDAVDAGRGSPLPMFSAFLLAPVAALSGSLLVLSRFRAGVREGVIATSMSELEERLDREMSGIRVAGVGGQPTTRAFAALNSAIGDTPDDPPPPQPPARGAESPSRMPRSPLRIGRNLTGGEDPDFRRPI